MKPEIDIIRLEDCVEWLESSASLTSSNQSIAFYIDHIGKLVTTMAWVNGQMAVAAEILNERKVKAYESLALSSVANEKYFAPSLAKDFIAAKCSQEQYIYDIAERASRTCVHQTEAFRSVLSALKVEQMNYGRNQ